MLVISIFFTLLFIQFSTENAINPRISGGQTASPDQFQFMASVHIIMPPLTIPAHTCAAVILTAHWLLSSAACALKIRSIGAAQVYINMFYTSGNEKVQKLDVNDTKIHEYFNISSKTKPNDLGLLQTAKEIYKPVMAKLPDPRHPEAVDVLMIGWGRTSSAVYGNVPEALQFAVVRIIENQHCQKLLPSHYEPLKESHICVKKVGKPITGCKGDSGGPLIRYVNNKPEIIGILSWAMNPCGQVGMPTVSSRVSYFNTWITEKVGKLPNRMSESDNLYTPLLVTG